MEQINLMKAPRDVKVIENLPLNQIQLGTIRYEGYVYIVWWHGDFIICSGVLEDGRVSKTKNEMLWPQTIVDLIEMDGLGIRQPTEFGP